MHIHFCLVNQINLAIVGVKTAVTYVNVEIKKTKISYHHSIHTGLSERHNLVFLRHFLVFPPRFDEWWQVHSFGDVKFETNSTSTIDITVSSLHSLVCSYIIAFPFFVYCSNLLPERQFIIFNTKQEDDISKVDIFHSLHLRICIRYIGSVQNISELQPTF
jgi:hypothetical protein